MTRRQYADCESYSVIEHVARILCLSDWEHVLMVMLTTAFDVSNDELHHKFLVMAGFVSDARRWEDFDVKWRARLKEDGLAYFHMQRFAQKSDMFKGWGESRRQGLINDLLEIITEHAYRKFGVVVQAEAADSMGDPVTHKHKMIVIAGCCMAGEVDGWRVREHYRNSADFVIEQGDPGKGELTSAINQATGKDPIFRPKKDDDKRGIVGFTPLQAADIFAFELKKIADDGDKPLPPNFQFRFPYEQLHKMAGHASVFNMGAADDVGLCLKVDQYFKKNPLK